MMPLKTYDFKVVVEPDEDFDGNPSGFHAYCPVLQIQGASTWGSTEAEALKNINDVVHMVVENMLEHGERVPEEPTDQVEVTVRASRGSDRLIRGHQLRTTSQSDGSGNHLSPHPRRV